MRDSVKLKILFPILGFLLFILAAASTYSIIYSQKIKSEFRAVGKSYTIINHLDNLVLLISETEGNMRGYILSSNVHFLYLYEDNMRKAKAEIAILKALEKNNIKNLNRIKIIESLFDKRKKEISRLLDEKLLSKETRQLTFDKFSYALSLNNKIKAEKAYIELKEKKALFQEQLKATSTLKLISIAIIFSGISALITAMMILIIFYNEYLFQQRLKNELTSLNESKNRFFSIVSHDLRGPINSALILSTFLKDQKQSITEEDKEETILFLHKSLIKIQNLLEILLKWGKLQMNEHVYKPESFSIKEVSTYTAEYLSPLFSQKKLVLDIKTPSRLKVFADKNMVETILRNLISNAIKYTPEDGCITIDAAREGGNVIIKIIDSGVGISEEILHKLFSIDYKISTKGTSGEDGTGLGLKLCKEFVEKNGGKIWVQKNETRGTTFLFSLPASY